jgi:hypothetical protein
LWVSQLGQWVVGESLIDLNRLARINEFVDIRWHQVNNSRMQGWQCTPLLSPLQG